jgi:hypothetical protein
MHPGAQAGARPVDIEVAPALTERNRLTTAFRPILAIPHVLLVGGPAAFAITVVGTLVTQFGVSTGVLGSVAAVCSLIAWFAIVFGGQYPPGLKSMAIFYLRWRVRGIAYLALLRDEYPPFGDEPYPASLVLNIPETSTRDRVSVGFRLILALPHILAVTLLGLAWMLTTLIAWFSILFTGRYPAPLYEFGVGVLRWSTRVEAYLLLLYDEYPPFSLT